MRKRTKGFSLSRLLVLVKIVGIIVIMLLPTCSRMMERYEEQKIVTPAIIK